VSAYEAIQIIATKMVNYADREEWG